MSAADESASESVPTVDLEHDQFVGTLAENLTRAANSNPEKHGRRFAGAGRRCADARGRARAAGRQRVNRPATGFALSYSASGLSFTAISSSKLITAEPTHIGQTPPQPAGATSIHLERDNQRYGQSARASDIKSGIVIALSIRITTTATAAVTTIQTAGTIGP
jgi:hypothetical protein